ncbi:MAG TPA: aldo/keto reductase [Opitutaceae bacterium]|nr:aldo/keto reductase [Opitutaceae bacterium]
MQSSTSILPQRPCGRSGLSLPVLGLGTWSFGGGNYWGPQDQGDVNAVVEHALDQGITYFDTAEMYNAGASETSLGLALRGRRDRAVIGSKISPGHTRPATLRLRCEASLRRLGTEWIDLYMVHWPIHAGSIRHFTDDADLIANPPSVAEAFLTLSALQKEGKIRYIGVSNFGPRQMAEVRDLGVPIAVNELPYNLLMRGIETDILPYCRLHGIGILGYMTLMQGVLAGDFESFDALPPMRTRTRHFSSQRSASRHGENGFEPETWSALEGIRQIAREEGIPLADLAIAWALSNPDISCVLAGCRTLTQLEENTRAVHRRLEPGVLRRLNAATEEVRRLLGPNPDYYQGLADTRSW